MRIRGRCAAILGLVLGVAACSSVGEEDAAPETTAWQPAAVEVESETSDVDSDALPSAGSVTIGDVQYELSFECFVDEGLSLIHI